jgi:hypothetical protein
MRDTRTEYILGEQRSHRFPREKCQAQGCTKATTDKDFCIDHIEFSPHAKAVLAGLDRRAEEERKATSRRGWKFVDVNGSRAQEIVEHLQSVGAQTPRRLAFTVDLSPEALNAYLVALKKAKLIKMQTVGSRRGEPRLVVMPVEKAAG